MDEREEIRRRLDIVDYISTYVRLNKRGKNFLGLCPFHSEKTPSFNVSRERQWYKCFGCGEGGDLFSFVMKMDGLSFREALERLAERAGVELKDRPSGPSADLRERARAMHHEAGRFYAQLLWNTPDALAYARGRGLEDETLRRFGIGWAPDSWDSLLNHLGTIGWTGRDLFEAGLARANPERGTYYDAFRSRLMFPIFDLQNRVIAFGGRIVGDGEPKYLNSPEGAIFNKTNTLYALNLAARAIAEEDRALVMEGYTDVVAAHQAGVSVAVATLGTSLTEEHVAALARRSRRVILAFDADSAGIRAALRAGPMFEEAEMDVRLLVMPDGHDPDTYIKAHGAAAFAERLDAAVPLMDFQLAQLRFQHDMESAEGRTAYVRAALPVLATIRSNVVRDGYVRQLAEVWAQGDMARVAYREEDIRRDLAAHRRRMIAEMRAKWRGQQGQSPAPAAPGTPVAPTLAETPPEEDRPADPGAPSGLVVAEREALRALLQSPRMAKSQGLEAEEFSVETHRRLAALVLQRDAAEGDDPLADVAALPEAVAQLATELTLREHPPVTDTLVADAVERMRIHARQRRLMELKDLMAQGALGADDPRWAEWQELQRQARVSDRSRVVN